MFKKISVLQITSEVQKEVRDLIKRTSTLFEEFRFAPPSSQEKSRMGFSPNGFDNQYVSMLGDDMLLCVSSQGKTVSKFEVQLEMERIKSAMLEREPSTVFNKNTDKVIKEDATTTVTARAPLTEPKHSNILIRPDGMVIVEGSGKSAEDVISMVRKVLGSFPAFPVEISGDVNVMLKKWVTHDGLKGDIFTLGSKATILSGEGMEYKTKGEDLSNDDNAQTILKDPESIVTSVEVEYDGVIGLTLTDKLTFEGLKFDKDLVPQNEEDLYAGMLIVSKELTKMIDNVLLRLEEA